MDETTARILDVAQGDLPLEERPFLAWAREAGASEEAFLDALHALVEEGAIRRFGGVFDSRAMGWTTTLVGAKVDADGLDKASAKVAEHPGATHVYVRDHELNLWFTLAVRRPEEIGSFLAALEGEGLVEEAWSMPMTRRFKLQVRFETSGAGAESDKEPDEPAPEAEEAPPRPLTGLEEKLVSALQGSAALRADFFGALAEEANAPREEVFAAIQGLKARGALKRIGAVVRHQRVGFAHNAMLALRVDAAKTEEAGRALASLPFVSHAYERETPPAFPYNLFAMVHAGSAAELEARVKAARQAAGASEARALESVREVKKESMRFIP